VPDDSYKQIAQVLLSPLFEWGYFDDDSFFFSGTETARNPPSRCLLIDVKIYSAGIFSNKS
jgi:hypothetical protein